MGCQTKTENHYSFNKRIKSICQRWAALLPESPFVDSFISPFAELHSSHLNSSQLSDYLCVWHRQPCSFSLQSWQNISVHASTSCRSTSTSSPKQMSLTRAPTFSSWIWQIPNCCICSSNHWRPVAESNRFPWTPMLKGPILKSKMNP